MKESLKTLLPPGVLQWMRRQVAKKHQEKFAAKSVAETFSEIYERNVWGGARGELFSGTGSHERYADQYADTIGNFIRENRIKKVVDLGCGDFRVAAKFVTDEFHYTGCDVVSFLVEHNQESFGDATTEFRCLNIIEDELPDGELCLIRQVLQHLSNAEAAQILKNCQKYKYLIVTEHYPRPDKKFVPNLDIPHGPEMRLHYDSAICLDEAPFNLKNVSLLLDAEAEEGTRIKSFLVSNER